jgi:hypothetical protein
VAETPREFVGRWSGRIAAGAEDDHARFVDELRTPALADLLRRANLTEYTLYQNGPELDVVFKAERPSITAGFLRNRRLWPQFWEFVQPGDSAVEQRRPAIFHWARE